MESEDIWEIAKFALNVVSENYKEEPWDCIIDNDERAIYEILNKYTKDKRVTRIILKIIIMSLFLEEWNN